MGPVDARPSFSQLVDARQNLGMTLIAGLDLDMTHRNFPSDILRSARGLPNARYVAQTEAAKRIIDATAPFVVGFKPNLAFFEDDEQGRAALRFIIEYSLTNYPELALLGDAKNGDILHTNNWHARRLFRDREDPEHPGYDFDAVTLHSFIGDDTYPPFLAYPGRGIFALCKTSNPESHRNQDLIINLNASVENGSATAQERYDIKQATGRVNVPNFWLIAYRHGIMADKNPEIGIVVGATHAESFKPVRRLFDGKVLSPGIGAQGGDLAKTVKWGYNSAGRDLLINAGREQTFADDPGTAMRDLHEEIQRLRSRRRMRRAA